MTVPRTLLESGTVASGVLDNAAGRITWHAWRETTGSATATLRIWDSSKASGKLLIPIQLNAGESTRDYTGTHAIPYETGLYLEVVSGTVEGQILAMTEREWMSTGAPVFVIGEVDVNIAAGLG